MSKRHMTSFARSIRDDAPIDMLETRLSKGFGTGHETSDAAYQHATGHDFSIAPSGRGRWYAMNKFGQILFAEDQISLFRRLGRHAKDRGIRYGSIVADGGKQVGYIGPNGFTNTIAGHSYSDSKYPVSFFHRSEVKKQGSNRSMRSKNSHARLTDQQVIQHFMFSVLPHVAPRNDYGSIREAWDRNVRDMYDSGRIYEVQLHRLLGRVPEGIMKARGLVRKTQSRLANSLKR